MIRSWGGEVGQAFRVGNFAHSQDIFILVFSHAAHAVFECRRNGAYHNGGGIVIWAESWGRLSYGEWWVSLPKCRKGARIIGYGRRTI